MAKKLIKRIQRDRFLTAEEAARDEDVRRKVREEFPPKKRASQQSLQPVEISGIMRALKEARTSQGMTLAEAARRAEIEPPNLSTLENSPDANPTLHTLVRYADALGKTIRVVLEDARP
jgi:DNA-binding XRE family transcriptional regulator